MSYKVLREIRKNPGIDTRLLIINCANKYSVTKHVIAGCLSYLKKNRRIQISTIIPKRYSTVQ